MECTLKSILKIPSLPAIIYICFYLLYMTKRSTAGHNPSKPKINSTKWSPCLLNHWEQMTGVRQSKLIQRSLLGVHTFVWKQHRFPREAQPTKGREFWRLGPSVSPQQGQCRTTPHFPTWVSLDNFLSGPPLGQKNEKPLLSPAISAERANCDGAQVTAWDLTQTPGRL